MVDGSQIMGPVNVAGVGGLGQAGGAGAVSKGTEGGKTFAEFVLESLNEVNRLQKEADVGIQRLITGETDNVAEVFALSNKAGMAFDMLLEVRNRLMEAYREIQQMQV